MSKIAGEKRKYNSTRRREQARETQRQIVEAAHRLFMARGWAGTTIEAIAAEAGVAVETVYSVFRSKRAILARLVAVSVRGDDDPTPLMERPGPQGVRKERDQRMQLRLLSRGISETLERVGPLFGIMRTAAQTEPELAALLASVLEERLMNMGRFVGWIADNGPLREGLGLREAAENVWALSSPEVHHLLTMDLGWSRERYSEWLADTLITILLP